ncbi:uncharacterized protein LOC133884310 [Phragmites australis]|uniref:uncharacterized protein LOC133884310 n=1 Tax=Phragmites australis TaxID=29695 RepID=UPI002D77C76A|nr:uncharacterized protein LOC133884310 [Phragmites australis]
MGNCACSASRYAASWTDDGEPGMWPGQQGESSEARTGVEVTIRVSKLQLQELMAKAAGGGIGGKGMTIEKVLVEIADAGEVVDGRHRRRWEPALRSIPEADES